LAGRKKKREPVLPKYRVPIKESDETHPVINVASKEKCNKCQGTGTRLIYGKISVVCDCVYRSCFQECVLRHRDNTRYAENLCWCSLERSTAGTLLYGYKNIEFGADMELIAKRTLTPRQYFIFTRYHIWGLMWSTVCDKVGMTRGNFFRLVYTIESVLGQALMETNMFPPHKYFSKHQVEVSQVGKPTQAASSRG
jgi:hypothetical protein